MPSKPISRRFEWMLMAFHHPSPPHVHAATATTPYQQTTNSTFGSDFGSGSSSIDKKTGQLSTTSTLSPGLQTANSNATMGLNSNLGYLARDPSQVYSNMLAGNDPYYNAMQEQTARANAGNVSNAQLAAARSGNANSTTLGSTLGSIAHNNQLEQNQNLGSAFTMGNQTANQNAATAQNAITGLANLSYPLGSAANSNLNTALGAQGQNSQFNAGQVQNANSQNAQLEMQQRQQNSASTGGWVKAGLTAAALAAAPFTGGASLMAVPAIQGGGGGNTVMGGSSYQPYYNPAAGQYGTLPGGQVNARIEPTGGLRMGTV